MKTKEERIIAAKTASCLACVQPAPLSVGTTVAGIAPDSVGTTAFVPGVPTAFVPGVPTAFVPSVPEGSVGTAANFVPATDGLFDGNPDGDNDGATDGLFDGEPDGANDGAMDGTLDGLFDGEPDGAAVDGPSADKDTLKVVS